MALEDYDPPFPVARYEEVYPEAGDTPEGKQERLQPERARTKDAVRKAVPREHRTNNDTLGTETTWSPVDLSAAVAGIDVPPPSVLTRVDGVCLLYEGRVHWFQGEPESCKTWAALAAAAQVLDAGGTVLWIDFEDDENGVVARLLALGVVADVILSRFTYLHPDEPLIDRTGRATAGALELARVLDAERYRLAVIDGVTEAMVTDDLDILSNADIARWMRRLPKRIAAITGAAVVGIDHVTKARESQGRYAIGGQHKLAGITGATYRFDAVRPFARPVGTTPSEGSVAVVVMKDRPGYVRARAVDARITTMELTGYPDGGVSIAFTTASATIAPDMALCSRLLGYLSMYEGATQNQCTHNVEGKTDAVRDALRWMTETERAWITVQRVGNAHRHYLTDAGREQLPDD
jgi:hypothetical protein